MLCGIHTVTESNVAVYYRNGMLLQDIGEAGINWRFIVTTRYCEVRIRIQTDEVENIKCATKDGVPIEFERIEIINILNKNAVYKIVQSYTCDYDKDLIFNKIYHEMSQLSTRYTVREIYIDKFDEINEKLQEALQRELNVTAAGLTIFAVRVSKPKIPDNIQQQFSQEVQKKLELEVVNQEKLVQERKATTEKEVARIRYETEILSAEKEKNKTLIETETQKQKLLILAEGNKEREKIEAEIRAIKANTSFYEAQKMAEGNKLLFTQEYLTLQGIKSVSDNTKIYFGSSIPNMFTLPFNYSTF